MNIELTAKEYDYLRTIIGMDQRLKNERLLNAAASSSRNFSDPDMILVDGILDAMVDGQLKDLIEQATLQIEIGSLDSGG